MEASINPQALTLPSNFRMFFSFPGNPVSYLGVTNSSGSLKVIVALSIDGRQRHIAVGPALTVGSWSHVVATYDGSRLTLHVNGDVAGQITGLAGAISIGATGVLLGGHRTSGNDFAFDGVVGRGRDLRLCTFARADCRALRAPEHEGRGSRASAIGN